VSAKFCNVAAKRRAYNGVRSSPWDRIDSSRFNRMLRPVSPLLIREGFSQGVPGEQLAEAAGFSVARVYQIRDGRR
jgi:hypothetical protein